MNYRMILYLSGQILRVLGGLMILPLLVALIYNEPASRNAFAFTALVLLGTGSLITWKKPENKSLYNREGLATVAIAWLLVSIFGGIPFLLSGDIPNYADCIFEITSGFTTTGSTILTDVESMSHATLFWRAFSHFLGGMGVLVFMLAILPHNDTRTMHIVRAESPGPTVGKLVAKMSFSVRILYGMYIALTLIMTVFLLFGGMDLFEALCHAFATAGTGGFGITNNSVADYNSVYIDVVITIFMGLFGINFTLYYLLLMKKWKSVLQNEELRVFLGICVVSILLIAFNIMNIYGSFWQGLRYSSFQVMSTISTT
ncbi:MAG: TrkH family potassium uptake protein, partial [Oscillospiraceae bacterium]|nr:TrkH family potassium uptake protein [Oscillospiraceae bacterium]